MLWSCQNLAKYEERAALVAAGEAELVSHHSMIEKSPVTPFPALNHTLAVFLANRADRLGLRPLAYKRGDMT